MFHIIGKLQQEKGTAAIIFALSLSVLVGFSALVTDLGSIYINRARISNTLDSAVLAGAQELPLDAASALNKAEQYALTNGMQSGEYTFTVSGDNRSITGIATRVVGMFFARAFGVESKDVAARARARVAPAASVTGVVPFGVLEDNFTYGEEVTLKEGAGDQFYKGWFGCLRLGGSGASIYRDNVKYGYQGEIHINQIIDVEDGNNSGPTRDGIEYRIDQCHHTPQCSYTSYVEGCPRIILVPIIHPEQVNDGGAVATVRVVSFAAFLVDSYVGSGNNNEVMGCFIPYHVPATVDDNVPEHGLYGVQLCE